MSTYEVRIVEKGKIVQRVKCSSLILGCTVAPQEGFAENMMSATYGVKGNYKDVNNLALHMGHAVVDLLLKDRATKLAEVKG